MQRGPQDISYLHAYRTTRHSLQNRSVFQSKKGEEELLSPRIAFHLVIGKVTYKDILLVAHDCEGLKSTYNTNRRICQPSELCDCELPLRYGLLCAYRLAPSLAPAPAPAPHGLHGLLLGSVSRLCRQP